jgi:hypothetical protein
MVYWSSQNNDIYHICNNCPIGRTIKAEHRQVDYQPLGRRLCERCRDLEAIARCAPDVPEPPYLKSQ